MTEPRTYNPLDRATYEALAYNAIGRASEIGTYPAYQLTHSSGNSGWSVGAVQWDFGQPGRGHKVEVLLNGYQTWAPQEQRFTDAEVASLSRRLLTPGQVGNALTTTEQSHLGAYLRSDSGREFVDGLNREQIDRKWTNVGEPLSRIPWLQTLAANDPAQAAEIVAMTSKLYNQNENRGGVLIRHLHTHELTAAETSTWIGDEGIRGLNQNARAAIVSGRDNALAGTRLFNALEASDGRLGQAWRREIHDRANVALSREFNSDPDVQLLDGMMRNPVAGERILANVDRGTRAQATTIAGINPAAQLEMSRITLDRDGTLTVASPAGDNFQMTEEGWNRNGVPMQRTPTREIDRQDHMEPGRMPIGPIPRLDGLEQEHPLLRQSRAAVDRLDQSLGRAPDQSSACMSASLACLAQENGLTQIDHVVLDQQNGRQGENVLVVQGGLDDPAHRIAYMKTSVATQTPMAESLQRLEQVEHSVAQQTQLALEQPDIGMPRRPSMTI